MLNGCESGGAPAAAPTVVISPTVPDRVGVVDLSQLTGLENVSLRMPADEVKALLPAAAELGDSENLGAGSLPGPLIDRYVLRDRSVSGLPKPVTLELRFWKNKLWVVNVIAGENGMSLIDSLLRARLGAAGEGNALRPAWVVGDMRVAASLKKGWYAVSDEQLSAEARAWFAEVLRDGMKMRAPAEATPGGDAPVTP